MIKVIDSHHHITEGLPIKGLYNTYEYKTLNNLKNLKSGYNSIGVHPLHIENSLNFKKIGELLKSNKNYCIGEVGLDRRGNNKEEQIKAFKEFLKLSITFNRPVSIHCVKAWGDLINILEVDFNRDIPILLHGYFGSRESMNTLLNRNSFFSFSLKQLENPKIIKIIKSMPIENLLIESDMLNSEYLNIGNSGYLDIINRTYRVISEIRNISFNTLADTLTNNFNKFTRSTEL